MDSTTTATYIYAYIAFAVVYLASAAALAVAGFSASTKLARCARRPQAIGTPSPSARIIPRAFRLLDWVQGSALLAIGYVVASAGLGSLILKGQPAFVVNLVWIALTAVAAGVAIVLAVLGTRELVGITEADIVCTPGDRISHDLQRVSTRLGASAVVVLLVGTYVAVNLVSVLADLGELLKTDFVL